jgi:peptidoglycan/xylan/chitin deacetylase (PgdA/CDA1 family)
VNRGETPLDGRAEPSGAPPPLALAYHGIADVPLRDDPHGLFVRPGDLVRHVSALRSWGYRLVPFSELADAAAAGRGIGLAALTFDDGLADNLEVLAPLLAGLDAPATAFVCTGLLGGRHPRAAWARILRADEVPALAAAGLEIGSHGSTHRDLSALPYGEARDDLAASKGALEELTGAPVRVAAYPFGRASAETIRACADAGFSAACRTTGVGSWDEPHNLPRQDMTNRCTLTGLRLKRDDRYEPLMRTLPGRGARRLVHLSRTLGRR